MTAGKIVGKMDTQKQLNAPLQFTVVANSAKGVLKKVALCAYPGCPKEANNQCAHNACSMHITHCHYFARIYPQLRCFFHPPPRKIAVSAVLVNGRWQSDDHDCPAAPGHSL